MLLHNAIFYHVFLFLIDYGKTMFLGRDKEYKMPFQKALQLVDIFLLFKKRVVFYVFSVVFENMFVSFVTINKTWL